MKRKITILKSHREESVKQLIITFNENPYHARVLFMSADFANRCFSSKYVKEEYIDENGNKDPERFRLYFKVTFHEVSEDLKLITRNVIQNDMGFKYGKFYKKSNLSHPITKFQLVTLDKVEYAGKISSGDYKFNNELTFSDIIIYSRYSKANTLIFKEWVSKFPWMIFMYEHNILKDVPLNEIIEKGLTNLKKAMTYTYNFPYPVAKKIHAAYNENRNDLMDSYIDVNGEITGTPLEKVIKIFEYFSNDSDYDNKSTRKIYDNKSTRRIKDDFFNLFDDVLINKENFQVKWLYYESNEINDTIIWNLLRYAVLMDRKVNCKWSAAKIKQMNNKWTKEYASIIYKYNNRPLYISDIFVEFSKMYKIPYLSTIADLAYEGFKMNHCVGGYEHNVSSGSQCIYTYGDNTIQIRFGGLDGLYHLKRNCGLKLGYLLGYYNVPPDDEFKKKIEDMVVEFNRYLFQLPLEEYLKLKNNVEETGDKYMNDINSNIGFDLQEEDVVDVQEEVQDPNINQNWGGVGNQALGRINRGAVVEEPVMYEAIDELPTVEEVINNRNLNETFYNHLVTHFGDMEEGDIISAEGEDGTEIKFIILNGRIEFYPLEVDNTVDEINQTFEDLEENIGEDLDYAAGNEIEVVSNSIKKIGNEVDMMATLIDIFTIHEEIAESTKPTVVIKDDIFLGEQYVESLFDLLVTHIWEGNYKNQYFVTENYDLIEKCVNSDVNQDKMNDIIRGAEHKLALLYNPYYDLMDALTAEM